MWDNIIYREKIVHATAPSIAILHVDFANIQEKNAFCLLCFTKKETENQV